MAAVKVYKTGGGLNDLRDVPAFLAGASKLASSLPGLEQLSFNVFYPVVQRAKNYFCMVELFLLNCLFSYIHFYDHI